MIFGMAIRRKKKILQHYGVVSRDGLRIQYYSMTMICEDRRVKDMYSRINKQMWVEVVKIDINI